MKKTGWIYLYNFLHYSGSSISEVFSAALLYNIGFDISQIFMFFGLKWGIMGALTPLMPVITSRIGYIKAEAISVAALLSANLILVINPFESASLPILFILLTLYGIGGALTTPIQTTMKVMFIPEAIRGAVNGRLFAVRALSVMATSFAVGFFLDNNVMMISFVATTMSLSLIPVSILFRKTKRPAKHAYKTTIAAIFSRKFRPFIPVFMLRSFMHIEKFLISLFLYLLVGDIAVLAVYTILTTLVEMAVMMVFGTSFDAGRKRTLRTATLFRSLSSVFLLIKPAVEKLPIFGQVFSRITGRGHDTVYQAFEQRLIRRSGLNSSVGAAAVEATICFAELAACIGFSAISLTLGHDIFYLVFAGSFLAAWLVYLRLRKV